MFNIIERGTHILVLAALVLIMVAVPRAQAADIVTGELRLSYVGDGPWFTLDKMAPGDIANKSFTVENTGQENRDLKVMIDGSGYDDGLAEAIKVSFWNESNMLIVSDFKRLWDDSATIITLSPGNSVALEMRMALDDAIGNDFQNRSLGPVNIYIGFNRESSVYQVTTYSNPLPGSSRRIMAGLGTIGDEPTIVPPETVGNEPTSGDDIQADTGQEVLGASTEEPSGEPWWPWLIIPAASVLAILAISKHWLRDIGVPLLSGGVAGVAALMTDGPIATWVFWTILAAEFVIGAGALYFVYEEEALAAAEQTISARGTVKSKTKKHK